jgi:integrase
MMPRSGRVPGSRVASHYDLRRTAATILLKQPEVAQERLGHSAIVLMMDTYSHVLEGMREAATEAMDSALGSSRWDSNHDLGT